MTIVQQACRDVQGFEDFYRKFLRKMAISDRADSTSKNYGRTLAALAIYYQSLPTAITQDQIDDYLYLKKKPYKTGSDSYFKFVVCSLRFAFRMEGKEELRMSLPVIKERRKLPVVLSKEEITAMMNIPCKLRHRVLIALLYGCGLRCGEIRNIKVDDVDLLRNVLHVRQGKGKKDRYMPLGNALSGILRNYIRIQRPETWLFPGKRYGKISNIFKSDFEQQFGQRSVQWAIKRAAQVAGIAKQVNVHSLRHTYATHLLEDGVNILTIKELLGHAHISTTMIYLHVAQVNNHHKCSPIDKLEGLRVIGLIQGEINFN